ncbi:MAG: DEAD/DEAH box helicase [Chloroflexota bacterium]|nr:DEAD/DEAH box helicase [Chloroflexota bacterium]MDE2885922.1 DEAD/DEAH box helicase [Chloroflexota bacterium]
MFGNLISRFFKTPPAPPASEPVPLSTGTRSAATEAVREPRRRRPPRATGSSEQRPPRQAEQRTAALVDAPDAPSGKRRRSRGGRGRRKGDEATTPEATLGTGAPTLGPSPRELSFGPVLVSEPVKRALDHMRYESPTPIQELVIDPLLNGEDVVGQAQTGTGKTAGFGIPIAELVDAREAFVQAIVLVPTRELARQVTDEVTEICRYRGTMLVPVYGGARLGPQISALQDGAQVVVGTPGRVIDLLDRGVLRLDKVRLVVLDEADQMLDIGFLPDVRRILRSTPRSRQTALFTATIPTMIKRLIYSYLRDPRTFRVGEEAEPVEQVTQRYCEVASRDKLTALLKVLDEDEQTLVFRRTQDDVDWLVRMLERRRVKAAAIHGGLPQGERNAVMQRFRSGALKLLVSTNLTSRGIDVPTVANVINYDIPESVEEYVHRIGRTARMGREGTALTFVSEWDLDFFDAIKAHVGDDLQPLELGLYTLQETSA